MYKARKIKLKYLRFVCVCTSPLAKNNKITRTLLPFGRTSHQHTIFQIILPQMLSHFDFLYQQEKRVSASKHKCRCITNDPFVAIASGKDVNRTAPSELKQCRREKRYHINSIQLLLFVGSLRRFSMASQRHFAKKMFWFLFRCNF